MKKIIVMIGVAMLVGICSVSTSQAANVKWTLIVDDGFSPKFYNAENGGSARVGLSTCDIGRPSFIVADQRRLQTVDITCNVGLGTKVTLSTACQLSGGNTQFAWMVIRDSLTQATLTLICRN